MATEKRTITLTERAPVRIITADWPEIACADWHNGEVASQATRKAWIKVRQHEDGRTLVYGGSTSQYRGERDLRAGYLLAKGHSSLTIQMIRAVAQEISHSGLAAECIADLPAEEI